MKPEAQRIAIAEVCGFLKSPNDDRTWLRIKSWKGSEYRGNHYSGSIPDYIGDLNAMHEAEQVLNPHQRIDYVNALTKITVKDPEVSCWDLVHVMPQQRAEAFLKTLNIWKD